MVKFIHGSQLTRRTFLKTSVMAAGSVAGAEAFLSACGGTSPSSSTPSSGPVTLNVLYGSELADKDIAAFEKLHPNIKVKNAAYDRTRLDAMLAAGTAPDVVRIDGAPQVPNFASRGIMLDLSKYFDKSTVIKTNDLQPINEVYRWDGSKQGSGPRYGLVKDWSQDVMIWYNKTLFDQAKVPYPSETTPMNYSDLLTLAEKLTVRKGGKVQVYGLSPSWDWNTQGHMIQMLTQNGASIFNADLTQADFTTPEVRKVLQWYIDWAQAHVGPSPLDIEANGDLALFGANRLAMITYGYWFGGYINSLTNGLPDHVGFAPTPQWGSKPVSSTFGATGVFIPKKSKNPDTAWTFVEYFFGGDAALARAKSGWGLPALKSMFSDIPQAPAFEAQAAQVAQQELPQFDILRFSPYIDNDAMNTQILKFINPVMMKQDTLDSATKKLTDAVNQLLQQGKEQVS